MTEIKSYFTSRDDEERGGRRKVQQKVSVDGDLFFCLSRALIVMISRQRKVLPRSWPLSLRLSLSWPHHCWFGCDLAYRAPSSVAGAHSGHTHTHLTITRVCTVCTSKAHEWRWSQLNAEQTVSTNLFIDRPLLTWTAPQNTTSAAHDHWQNILLYLNDIIRQLVIATLFLYPKHSHTHKLSLCVLLVYSAAAASSLSSLWWSVPLKKAMKKVVNLWPSERIRPGLHSCHSVICSVSQRADKGTHFY